MVSIYHPEVAVTIQKAGKGKTMDQLEKYFTKFRIP